MQLSKCDYRELMLPNLLVYRVTGLLQQINWCRLRSLTLTLWSSEDKEITSGITFLKEFHHLELEEVTVEVYERAIVGQQHVPVAKNLAHKTELCSELEQALLRFSHPRLVWIMRGPFISLRNSFWAEHLRTCFPALFQRGALAVLPNTGNSNSFSMPEMTNYLSRLLHQSY